MSATVILIIVGTLLVSLGSSALLQTFVGHIVKQYTDDPFISFFVCIVAIMLGLFFLIIGFMLIAPLVVL